MKVFVVVGESSGDLLASGVIEELKKRFINLEVQGIVGPKLISLGAKKIYSMDHLSLMGFIEPIINLPKLLYIRHKIYKRIIQEQPDLFIGVDAPEFNLGLEKKLKRANITTVHYVSPSVWAWRTGRVKLIRQAVSLMLTLFPFEVDFYYRHKIPAVCVGHHLADQVPIINQNTNKDIKQQFGFSEYDKILTIMPGSRDSELKHLTKIYLQTAKEIFFRFPFIKFLLPVISIEHSNYVEQLIKKFARNVPIKVIVQDSHRAIRAANFVLVTSGTATLEVLLHKKPMIVAYKTNYLTYLIIKKLIKVKYISLPNLLANVPLVQEFIQNKVTPYNLTRALSELISISGLPAKQMDIFNNIHRSLQKNASLFATQEIIKLLPCST